MYDDELQSRQVIGLGRFAVTLLCQGSMSLIRATMFARTAYSA